MSATAVFLVGGVGVIGATTDPAGAVIAAGTLVVESDVKKVERPTAGSWATSWSMTGRGWRRASFLSSC